MQNSRRFASLLLVLAACAVEKPSTPTPTAVPSTSASVPTTSASTIPPTVAVPAVVASTIAALPDGAPRVSDDCAADELKSGKCKCAHTTCFDMCCPKGYACAHHAGPDQGPAKCVHP
jgi:hypothetical protein